MSNEIYQVQQNPYSMGYDEWLETLRARNHRLRSMPDHMVERFGAQMYPREAKKVQPYEEYAFEEEKVVRLLDDEGSLGFIPEPLRMTMQKAYNEGLGGMFELVENGETPYPLIDKNTGKPYDFNTLQTAGAFIGSFFSSPIDIATLAGGGAVGKFIGKGILSGTKKFATNKLKNNLLLTGMKGGE